MAIFMKVPFAKGAAKYSKHEGWIKLDLFQFDIDRSISMEKGSLKSKAGGIPRFTEIVVGKYLDETTTALLNHLVGEEGGADIEFHLVMGSDKGSEATVKYKLKDGLFSEYSVNCTGEAPYETLKLTYSQMDMEFHPHDQGGGNVSTYKFSHILG